MKPVRTLVCALAPAALVPALLAPVLVMGLAPARAPALELAFVPRAGLALVKTFRSTSALELESSTAVVNGRARDVEQTRRMSSERRLIVTDRWIEVDGARATALERRFDELAWEREQAFSIGGTSEEIESSATCELVGHTVRFEWDEEAEEYAASSEGVDDDLLEELEFDLDFAALLPGRAVAEGDRWTVDADDFEPLLDPFEGLPLEWEHSSSSGRELPDTESGDDRPEPDETKQGEITVELRGIEKADGVELAVLHLEGELTVESVLDASEDGERGAQESHTEITLVYRIEGECRWDVGAGRFHSWKLEAELERSVRSEGTMRFGEREMTRESTSEESGTYSCEAAFEPAAGD